MVRDRCVCGEKKYQVHHRDYYKVTGLGDLELATDKLTLAECSHCGLLRQEEPRDYDYEDYPPVGKEYAAKPYSHDRELSIKRCDAYGIGTGQNGMLLDIGSGSGAFVDECRDRGLLAYGCEIAKYACAESDKFIYMDLFQDIYFPTDYFDWVTCHDVLEHVTDPKIFLQEAFRSTKQGGKFIVDIPDFFGSEGDHHWKAEHIWYFNVDQLKKLLKTVGFNIICVKNPIKSKIVIYCLKPEQKRVSIILPPGIGDSYWSLVKMQSFLEQKNIGIPDIYIACNKEKKYGAHKRSFPFLEMFPFIHSTGVTHLLGDRADKKNQNIWKEAYATEGRTVFKDVLNCDYFIAYNGHLRFGKSLEEIDKDLVCNWHPKMFESLEQRNFKALCKKQYGKYILFYFVFEGTYVHWTKEFSIESIIKFVNSTVEKTGCTPIFVGALWDAESRSLRKIIGGIPGSINLVGKTTIPQLFGLIRGSELVVGYPSGLTISSTIYKQKTIIIWNDYYNRDFAWNACSPEVRRESYFVENTKGLDIDRVVNSIIKIIDGEKSITRLDLMETLIKNKTKVKVYARSSEVMIACVLKSSNKYDRTYVTAMESMLRRNLTLPFKFVVLTNDEVLLGEEKENIIPLQYKLRGWWSKLELFQLSGPVLYFDLDTIILKNIDHLVRMVGNMPDGAIRMLTPFNMRRRRRGDWASGIMAWCGDFSFILENRNKRWAKRYVGVDKVGDQKYIHMALVKQGIIPSPIDVCVKAYSYKKSCENEVCPDDAEIICFHGNPPIHKLDIPLVRENWK